MYMTHNVLYTVCKAQAISYIFSCAEGKIEEENEDRKTPSEIQSGDLASEGKYTLLMCNTRESCSC